MNIKNEENDNQPSQEIDATIDNAVENAEVRRELCDKELDEVTGGIKIGGITIGLIAQNNIN